MLSQSAILICGPEDTSFHSLMKGWLIFFFSMNNHGSTRTYPLHASFARSSPLELPAFVSVFKKQYALRLSSYLQSSEPRDFVYSLFGMISDTNEVGLRVDYSRSVEKVYTDFAVAIVRASGIGGLTFFWDTTRKNVDLPSWVPDWSDLSMATRGRMLKRKFSGLPAQISSSVDGHRLLQVQGNPADCIREGSFILQKQVGIESCFDNLATSSDKREALFRCFLEKMEVDIRCCSLVAHDKSQKVIQDMFLSTSMADHFKLMFDGKQIYSSYCAFRGLDSPPEGTENP